MFWHHFLLNETARFGQNNTVSSTIKKKAKTLLFGIAL
jgi:hypothetical protein